MTDEYEARAREIAQETYNQWVKQYGIAGFYANNNYKEDGAACEGMIRSIATALREAYESGKSAQGFPSEEEMLVAAKQFRFLDFSLSVQQLDICRMTYNWLRAQAKPICDPSVNYFNLENYINKAACDHADRLTTTMEIENLSREEIAIQCYERGAYWYKENRAQAKPVKELELDEGPRWVKNMPQEQVYDGSIFACAIRVTNEKTKETNWDIDTVSITADEDMFTMNCFGDGDSGDSYSSWDWDDFEYVFPLNSDARTTVKEWSAKIKERLGGRV